MTSLPTLAWDSEDRLRSADLGGGGTAYFVYDASGQRVRKVIEGHNGVRRKERIYLAGFEIHREHDGDGVTVRLERESLHVLDDERRVALVETLTVDDGAPAGAAPVHRYQLGNHLGTVCVELDEAAAVISHEEYHPFGTTSFQVGRSATEVSAKRFRYTGKARDEETGLYYYGARYYAPWLVRWVSPDPLAGAPAVTLYAFVLNQPLRYFDPDGNAEWETQRRADTRAYKARHPEVAHGGAARTQPHHFTKIADAKTALPDTSTLSRATRAQIGADERMLAMPSSNAQGFKAAVEGQPKAITVHSAADIRSQEAAERSLKHHPSATGETKLGHLLEGGKEARSSWPATVDLEARAQADWARTRPEGGEVRVRPNGQVEDLMTTEARAEKMKTLLDQAGAAASKSRLANAAGKVATAGRHFLNALGPIGMVTGIASVEYAMAEGDTTGAALDAFGMIPGPGDVVDAARGGWALGGALEALVVDSETAMRHGDAAKALAERAGAGSTLGTVVGGYVAAQSAILQTFVKATPLGSF
jgi:RHS repeat-associated protein